MGVRRVDFIRAYKELCIQHGLMVAMKEDAAGYLGFVVVDATGNMDELNKACKEMQKATTFKLSEV